MAMNFFEHQEVARKNTGRLVVMFILAVIGIIVGVYLVVAGSLFYMGSRGGGETISLLNPVLLGVIAGVTILVVGGSSFFKIAQLSSGGSGIAQSLGGRLIPRETDDPVQQRLLNVIEEMAIASGVPCPPVYFMDKEQGINAFAAGYTPSDAVIGVTRGCAERLSRDELQGVMAHEFSHILNGDMKLNIRLIGILHGILVIGLIGYFILRSAFYGAAIRSSSRGRSNPLPLLAMGAGLVAVGSIGTFFGNWIKSAVSRQREFLADASAVQFTRNPEGIGGALKKIGGFSTGASIESPNAPQASHMFFGQAITSGFNSLFATHPPLSQRIKRIMPGWDGKFVKSESVSQSPTSGGQHAAVSGFAQESEAGMASHAVPPKSTSVASIGQPTTAHLDYARDLLQRVPRNLLQVSREVYGARALIYALLINRETEPKRKQIQHLEKNEQGGVTQLTLKLLGSTQSLNPEFRLPLIDSSMAALREMSFEQYKAFRVNIVELIKADDRMELFEWCLQRLLLHHLDAHFVKARPRRVKHYGLQRLGDPISQLLSTLAYVGHRDCAASKEAFEQGASHIPETNLNLLAPNELRFDQLDQAVEELDRVKPAMKQKVMEACAACIAADHEVTVQEAELFRAIGEALACPVPPLLPGQTLI
ncbi:MAG: M48 family metallopeptidase [Planctomycetota bacterium]|nr:M48 family metallopeptidase [Planctomycetota bacterium]